MSLKLIKNALIVNEGNKYNGSVVIENEYIKDILKKAPSNENCFNEVIDANGSYLIPGIIDDHVHFRDPGLTHKADLSTESIAAAAGGVTSIMDMPNTNPQTTSIEALENKFEDASKKCITNYSFYLGATNNNIDILPTIDKKHVCGVKLFMGASTGNMLVESEELLNKIFKNSPILIAAHCEDQTIIRKNIASYKEKYGEDMDVKYHSAIRSAEACYNSSSHAIRLAKENNTRLHILHISTAKELELFNNAPINEKQITCELCVAHLLFSDEDYRSLGSKIKCNPSIKEKANRDLLIKALSTNIYDVIGTDHAPHLLNEKEGGAIKAVSGMPMIQFSLITMMEFVRKGYLSIEQLVQKMSHNPADLYNIEQRGYIRKGYKADLVIVNPSLVNKITNEAILSKCKWSPVEGMSFSSTVEKTFINGNLIYSNNKVNNSFIGQALTFNR